MIIYKTKGFATGAVLFSLVLIFSSIGLACSASPTQAPTSPPVLTESEIPNYITYTDEPGLFSISYPSDWEVNQGAMKAFPPSAKIVTNLKAGVPVEGMGFMLFAGRRTLTGHGASLSVVVMPVPAGTSTLDGAVDAVMEVEREGFPDLIELSRTKTVVDGRQAIIVEWQGTLQQVYKQHYIRLYTIANKTVWLVDCAADDIDYNLWQSDFSNILGSLRIAK
jgi:hypothetical protein